MSANKQYIVLEGRFSTDLEKQVNIKIQERYIPIGGISIVVTNNSWKYLQAMIFNNDFKDKEDLNI